MLEFCHEICHFCNSQASFLMVQQQAIANDQIEQSSHTASYKKQDDWCVSLYHSP